MLYYITSLPKHHVPMEGGGLVKPQGTLPSSAFCTLHPWGNVGTTGAGGARPYLAPTRIVGTHPHLWRNEHAPYALANHTHNIICSCGQGSTTIYATNIIARGECMPNSLPHVCTQYHALPPFPLPIVKYFYDHHPKLNLFL